MGRIDIALWRTPNNAANPGDSDVPDNIYAPYDPAFWKVLKTKWVRCNGNNAVFNSSNN